MKIYDISIGTKLIVTTNTVVYCCLYLISQFMIENVTCSSSQVLFRLFLEPQRPMNPRLMIALTYLQYIVIKHMHLHSLHF